MGKYFGTDGIRGRANGAKMTPEIAMRVGLAAGRIFQRGEYKHTVVVGKDTRLSGYMLENAIIAGFTAAGVNVLRLGPVPTPAVAMLTRSMRADIGVMISASHNPYEDNGIKLFGPDGYKLSDAIEAQIEAALDDDMTELYADASQIGKATHIDSAVDRYIEYAKRTLPREATLAGLRIVVDCANGAAYKAAPRALWELGAEVVPLGVEPNGTNINDGVGSTHPELLRAKVREVRADIGIALDGDADRVIVVDENAHIVDGDQLMAAIAEDWHRKELLRHGGVVATVMSNLGFERHLSTLGLTLQRTKVGDRYVVETMRRDGYNLGGEQSGHIVMSDFATTGDGLVAALQLLACVQSADRPVSEVCRRFDPVPQLLRNVANDRGVLELDTVRAAIRGMEERLGDTGRLLIRPSGTEALIRIMAEGDDRRMIEGVVDELVGVIGSARVEPKLAA